jgi:hypothetical protein
VRRILPIAARRLPILAEFGQEKSGAMLGIGVRKHVPIKT